MPCRYRPCRRAANGVADFIPVARIADMLLNPGTTYRYNGQTRTYPDIRLVYWAGGNPFHHHQDLNRLRRAFRQVDTLVVHELAWTATARHADIVLPCTMTLERADIGCSSNDPLLVPMPHPAAGRRSPRRLRDLLRPGRTAWGSARPSRRAAACANGSSTYEPTRQALAAMNLPAPSFEEFWNSDGLEVPQHGRRGQAVASAPTRPPIPRRPPAGGSRCSRNRSTRTRSRTARDTRLARALRRAECRGAALPVANQPATRLHSQLDFGGHSRC